MHPSYPAIKKKRDEDYVYYRKVVDDSRRRYWRLKGEMFSLLGEKCVRCGFSDKRALQFDHVNGGGSKEDESGLTGQKQLNYYVNNPEIAKKTLQVLCANCNWIKRHEQNEEMRPFKHFPQHLERD